MILGETVKSMKDSAMIIIQSVTGTELYRGYKSNYDTKVNDDSEVLSIEVFTEVEKRPERNHVLPSIAERIIYGSTEDGQPIDNISSFELKDMKFSIFQKIVIKK